MDLIYSFSQVGGYDGASRQCLSTVECYDPEADSWSTVAEMSARRSGAGVGVLDNLLYAVGGHDGPIVRKSVEVYDPSTSSWRSVADMATCRRNAGITNHHYYAAITFSAISQYFARLCTSGSTGNHRNSFISS